jgi:hypothetical protein
MLSGSAETTWFAQCLVPPIHSSAFGHHAWLSQQELHFM